MPGDNALRDLLHAAVTAIGGVERPGQVRMAEEVADTLSTGEHLLVQAGTGIGKSLAYLVPALAHKDADGHAVVVATATLALQRQLIARDLPRTVEALAGPLGRRPSYAILKGRSNYLCLHRLHDGVPDDQEALFAPAPTSSLGREVLRVREWARDAETGDRDELSPGVSDRAWSQLSVSARECLGASRCPYGDECFAEIAREQARDADIVVTNHALLAIDALGSAPVLPEHGAVIVDEAHELAARATAAATDELTPALAERAARRAARFVDDPDAVRDAAEALRPVLDASRPGRLVQLPEDLAGALAALRDAARAVLSEITGTRDRDVSDDAARRQALAAIEGVFDTAERALAASEHDVVWVERSARFGPSLRVAPLAVAGLLREKLFAQRTAVLTSATLKLGGDFATLARSVGLE
ncbi:MAG: ATP-dependent DNA helicase, partial [Streptomycetales bacterium]